VRATLWRTFEAAKFYYDEPACLWKYSEAVWSHYSAQATLWKTFEAGKSYYDEPACLRKYSEAVWSHYRARATLWKTFEAGKSYYDEPACVWQYSEAGKCSSRVSWLIWYGVRTTAVDSLYFWRSSYLNLKVPIVITSGRNANNVNNKQAKIKTVLTGKNVAKTHTIKINQHNFNEQLKRSSAQYSTKNVVVLSWHKHTTLTIFFRNKILMNKPKQDLDAFPSKPSCWVQPTLKVLHPT
jgi:hypothetical protein